MSDPEPSRERLFNSPWPVTALAGAIVASFVIQGRVGDEAWIAYALIPVDVLGRGRWETLVTSLFLHGGWAHALMNAAGALAFGAPVARLFGTRAGGTLVFFLFYLLCGVLAGLGFVLLNPDGAAPLVGASGAVSGLMGAAARLIDRGGRVGPILGRTPVGMTIAWIVVNLVLGFIPLMPGTNGAAIAWQAHLAGYFAGLLLIGPFSRVLEHVRFAKR